MFFKRERGASAIETGIFIGLISIIILGALGAIQGSIKQLMTSAENTLEGYAEETPSLPAPAPSSAIVEAPADITLTQYELFNQPFYIRNIDDAATVSVTSSNSTVLSTANISVGSVENPYISFSTSAATDGTTVLTLSVDDGETVYADSFNVTIQRAASCAELAEKGVSADGTYVVDPDGSNGSYGFTNITVMCDFSRSGGPWTVIGHDKEAGETFNGTGCTYHTCKLMDLTYDVDETLLSYLAANSSAIEQDFSVNCVNSYLVTPYTASNNLINALFLSPVSDNPLQKFVARSDYFPGTIPCDSNSGTSSYTTTITDQFDILPVKTIWGGDVDGASEQATYTFGKIYLKYDRVRTAPETLNLPTFTVNPIADIDLYVGDQLVVTGTSNRDEAVIRFLQHNETSGSNFISPVINLTTGGYTASGSALYGTGTIDVEFYDAGQTITETVNVTVDYATSCLDWYNHGKTTSGTYMIDPDGIDGPTSPFRVTCDMNSSEMSAAGLPATGWTVLSHNHETPSADDTCQDSGCLVFAITYEDATGATLANESIVALEAVTSDVAQRFHKDCTGSVITKEYGSGTIYSNFIRKVGGTTKVALSTVTHYDNVAPDCNINDTSTARESDKLFINLTDILPIESIWGGDSDAAAELSSYTIGKLYMR